MNEPTDIPATDSSSPTALQLTLHARALRALGRRMLSSSADVDDLVQDTYLAALHGRPDNREGLRPWLAAVAHRLARRARRSDRRRRRREAAAAQAQSHTTNLNHGSCDIAIETELFRRMSTAVHELQEPYRTAIHLRYWHDLTPTKIAAELGVPLNTVRSRLQRGLAMLRRRMDRTCGQRSAWALPLGASLFRAGSTGAASLTVASSITTGVLLMKTKWFVAGTAALALAFLTFWVTRPPAVEIDPSSAEPGATQLTAGADADETPETPIPAGDRQGVQESRDAQTRPGITFRGRCVEANPSRAQSGGTAANPLANCAVDLRARDFLGSRESAFTPPRTVVTDASGRFVIRCDTAPRRLELRIQPPDSVAMSGWWDNLEVGTEIDVGDIPVQAGCLVRGEVVDTSGALCPGVTVELIYHIKGYTLNEKTVAHSGDPKVTSDADGAFQIRLPGGKWAWMVAPPHRAKNALPIGKLEIREGQSESSLEIQILRVLQAIRGVVVDEAGAPVAHAKVQVPSPDPSRLTAIEVESDAAGRFRIPRLEDVPDTPVQVSAILWGFQTAVSAEPISWGRDNVRLVLRRLPSFPLEILAVEAETGVPITDYAVRLAPDPVSTYRTDLRTWRPRLSGHHENGRVSLSARTGGHILTVEPSDPRFATPYPETIWVKNASLPVQRIEVHENVTRTLRVTDLEGNPAAGTRVELLWPVGNAEITLQSRVGDNGELPRLLAAKLRPGVRPPGWRLLTGTTDAQGELQLVGPEKENYALRLLGPGHVPKVVESVALANGLEPLIVVVARGATILGQVGPAASLAAIWPDGDLAEVVNEHGMTHLAPHVQFVSLGQKKPTYPPERGGVPVQRDGSFRGDAVPPGDWSVRFRYTVLVMGMSQTFSTDLATLRDLHVGEERRVNLDASTIAPGRLRATVFLDGEPQANRDIRLLNTGDGDIRLMGSMMCATDADARISFRLAPGRYQVRVVSERGGEKKSIISAPTAVVTAGESVEHTFRLFRNRVTIRVVTPRGKPVVGREFIVSAPRLWRSAGKTDADGWIVLDPAPVSGPFDLVTWPDELAELGPRRAHQRANRDTWRDVLIRLGTVECPTGQRTHEVELQMPR